MTIHKLSVIRPGYRFIVPLLLSVVAGVGLLAMLCLPGQTASAANAGAIVVNTGQDELNSDGDCSLREAIQATNTETTVDACPVAPGPSTITLPGGVYTLTLAGSGEEDNGMGDLDITGQVMIAGAGTGLTIVDGNQLDRVFHVHAGASVTLTALTIRHGRAPDGAYGGSDGSDGGGILNAGQLTMTDCVIKGNQAGDGGSGEEAAGQGGRGGGIFNAGVLTLTASLIEANTTGQGGQLLVGPTSPNWFGGDGGGIFNSGQLVMNAGEVRYNATAGHGGNGGGLANSGTLTVTNSSIISNSTPHAGGSSSIHGSGYTAGDGGGLYNTGWLTILKSTISANATGNGGDGSCGGPGSGGDGGGLANQGQLFLRNSTVSGNDTGDGGTAWCGETSRGSGGAGGGLYNVGTLELDNSTISANRLGEPESGGGGLANQTGPVHLRNTLLAANAPGRVTPDCSGLLTSHGFNLIGDATGCTLAEESSGNIIGRDPFLLPLADNGGTTWTQALAPGSPAIDTGQCTDMGGLLISVDQRDVPRPQGTTCDIGAYEAPDFPQVYLPLLAR